MRWGLYVTNGIIFRSPFKFKNCLLARVSVGNGGSWRIGGGRRICGESQDGKRWVGKDDWCGRRELCTRVRI